MSCRCVAVRPLFLTILLASTISLLPSSAENARGQVFSVDAASVLKRPADLFTPGPTLYARAESIGLLGADDIDALSFGFDDVTSPQIRFSLGYFATGALVSGNAVCSEAGLCAPGVPCPPEASADIFSTMGQRSATLLFDGDGVPGGAPSLGLKECPAGGPGVQDNVDAFDDLVPPLVAGRPAWRVYFSLAPGSPTLLGANPMLPGGAGPADILVYDPGHDSLSVYFTAASLGLDSADNVDGLSFNVITGDFLLSLAPGSPSLGSPAICPGGCTPGDLIRAAGPICGLKPCLLGGLGFASAGMASTDNADAVDQPGSPPPSIFDDTSPGKTYSLDPSSRSLDVMKTAGPARKGSPADLLTQDPKNPTGAPKIAFRAESLGLRPEDDIDGLSFGLEPTSVSGRAYALEFSVDRAAQGAPGTGVFTEASASGGSEAASDVFEAFEPAPPPPPLVPRNRQIWDGNGSSAPTLQLRESSPDHSLGDNLDALEGTPRIVDPDNDGVRNLPVYFSLAPGSPTLAAIGASPADILICAAPTTGACGAGGVPSVFISRAALGLAAGDNLQDFSLNAASGDVDFTVSPGAGFDPGAILKRPGTAGCPGASPCVIFTPADLGLLANDDLNALDSLQPVQVCVTITPGADPHIDVAHGICPSCPLCVPPVVPYDVIEGELGELTENPAGVDLSRVFCRADALSADRITLSGGLDPFTRGHFILVRNHAASDYGLSSHGNPRAPSSGDCP
jgi:hypothetical protein